LLLGCGELFHQGMFRRQHHEGRPPQGVRTGGENLEENLIPASCFLTHNSRLETLGQGHSPLSLRTESGE
jgi:hypothetical protein